MKFSATVSNLAQFDALKHMDFRHFYVPIYVLLSNLNTFVGTTALGRPPVIISPPAIILDNKWDKYLQKLNKCRKSGFDNLQIHNLSGLSHSPDFKLYGSAKLNVFNDLALKFWREQGLSLIQPSVELNLGQLKHMKSDVPIEVIGYGRIPVMTVENCPVNGNRHITDRLNVKFPVIADGSCGVVLNSKPIVMSDKLNDMKSIDVVNLYFTVESPGECVRVANCCFGGKPLEIDFTRGHFYKGV